MRAAFDKLRKAIEAGDFRSADVKKLHAGSYYRAKLDYANRLLLQFAHIDGETVCLALEVIENHAYERSRFLRGAPVDEARIDTEPAADATAIPADDGQRLRWLHPSRSQFELLDKPIVFDDAQDAVARLPAPVVIVGSAGSGKTAVTLAKLREAEGSRCDPPDAGSAGPPAALLPCLPLRGQRRQQPINLEKAEWPVFRLTNSASRAVACVRRAGPRRGHVVLLPAPPGAGTPQCSGPGS